MPIWCWAWIVVVAVVVYGPREWRCADEMSTDSLNFKESSIHARKHYTTHTLTLHQVPSRQYYHH